jgi:hypothetical protein
MALSLCYATMERRVEAEICDISPMPAGQSSIPDGALARMLEISQIHFHKLHFMYILLL